MKKALLTIVFACGTLLSFFLLSTSGLTDGQMVRGDCNGDGAINMKDVLILRKYIADLPVEFADHVCSVSPSASETDPVWTMPTASTQPSASQTEPSYTEPSYTQPSVTEPSYTAPSQTETQPSYTQPSYTQPSVTQPSYTQPSQTQPSVTQVQPTGDEVLLSLRLTKLGKYESGNVTETHDFAVPKNAASTVKVILKKVWHASSLSADELAGYVTMDPACTLVPATATEPNPSLEDVGNGNQNVTFTYTITPAADTTVAASVKYFVDNPDVVVLVNGKNSAGGTGETTKPSKDGTPVVPEENAAVDLVTLTFADENASSYGVSFHSFEALTSPKVQVVQGTASSASAFTGATEFAATTASAKMGEFESYNPLNYDFYYTDATEVVSYQHKATLSGLAAGTTYSYRVGDGATGKWSPIYTFTTKPASVGDFSFIFTADFQPELPEEGLMYKGVAQVMNAAIGLCPNPAFILHGGDFVYTDANGQNGISQWRNVINGCNNGSGSFAYFAETPWAMAAGNHDARKTPFFFNYANSSADANSLYYSFDYGDMHVVSLDTYVMEGSATDAAQLAWLQNDLASTDKKWKIVETHYSFYVNHNRDIEDVGTDTDRSTLLSLFDQYGVDVVLSAHVVQNYYTTYPVKAGVVTTTATTNQYGVDCYTNPGGTVYLQNGASGNSFGITNEEGKINGYGWSYPSLMKDSEAGHYGSFAVLKRQDNALTVNRYYLDEATKELKTYAHGQFGIVKN